MPTVFPPFIDGPAVLTLLWRLALDLGVALFLMRTVYWRMTRSDSYFFTYMVLNVLIFLVASVMVNAELGTGFAFGLFAIFSILRYRTSEVPIREMTFLFVAIIVGIINSSVTTGLSLVELLLANGAIVAVVSILSRAFQRPRAETLPVIYDRLDLLDSTRREELLADLSQRLGSRVVSVQVGTIDMLKETACLQVEIRRHG